MEITFLGTGTSHGVPQIGCRCEVCISKFSKNKRTRSSILIKNNSKSILIDTSTDFRFQVLKYKIESIDAILYTHFHADHVHGIDDLRRFNEIQGGTLPIYGSEMTIKQIKIMFPYIFNETIQLGGGKPELIPYPVEDEFELFGIRILPIKALHGKLEILGYRIDNVAYLTDCSFIPDESMEKLRSLKLLILGALRYRKHPTHFSLDEACKVIAKLRPQKAFITHIAHDLGHKKVNKELPKNIRLAFDGLKLEIEHGARGRKKGEIKSPLTPLC